MSTYVIAEIGINHNNKLENCFKMIDVAVESGCQAAKFQLFSAKNLYPETAGELDWKDGIKKYSYNIFDAVKSFELPPEWISDLISYCRKKKIDFLSSVFDIEGLRFLLKNGIKYIKLSSYTITNLPLIEAVGKTGLQVFLSTGGATLGETEEAVMVLKKYNCKIYLLHCSIKYPTSISDCNLGVIKTLKTAFSDLIVGYSDHTIEVSKAPTQAIFLGAKVIEKHITLDKKMEGPDHFFSLEPDELTSMVNDIREAEKKYQKNDFSIDSNIFGSSEKRCYEHEQYLRDFCYMTLFSGKEISKGEQIKLEFVKILRPGKKKPGLEPKYLKLFKDHKVISKKNIKKDDPITWETIL